MPFVNARLSALFLSSVFVAQAAITVQLNSSVLSPQPLGTPVTFTAAATDSNPGPLTYRYEIAASATAPFMTVSDFNTSASFLWASNVVEGAYQIRVTARDYLAGETAIAVTPFIANPILNNGLAVVVATSHPLVALFSAPTCASGSQMRVSFQRLSGGVPSFTNFRPCHGGSMNFYVAGMYPNSTYNMNYQVLTHNKVTNGPTVLPFVTAAIPASIKVPAATLNIPRGPQTDAIDRINLLSMSPPQFPFAADLTSVPVWYLNNTKTQLVRAVAGGTMLMFPDGPGTGTGAYGVQTRQQVIQEIDFLGNVKRQTNADRVSEQVIAMGGDAIGRFNHDAIRLPNGLTLALCDSQRIYPAGTQNSPVPIDIIGEVIVALDANFQVVWRWSSFDHAEGGTQLDIGRAAVRNEVCTVDTSGTTQRGCPPGLLLPVASDWLHGNSLQITADNNLLLSLRDQDWVIKIDYNNGAGTGNILWRLGLDGDFQIVGGDSSFPWFSGQHNASFVAGTSNLILFDNGNTRRQQLPNQNSRGMALSIDEASLTATVSLSADLLVFAGSQGSAQMLANGDYHFQPGFLSLPNSVVGMQSVEITPTNSQVYNLQYPSASYRTFRIPDLYSPPGN